jgi:hypothetical protein
VTGKIAELLPGWIGGNEGGDFQRAGRYELKAIGYRLSTHRPISVDNS